MTLWLSEQIKEKKYLSQKIQTSIFFSVLYTLHSIQGVLKAILNGYLFYSMKIDLSYRISVLFLILQQRIGCYMQEIFFLWYQRLDVRYTAGFTTNISWTVNNNNNKNQNQRTKLKNLDLKYHSFQVSEQYTQRQYSSNNQLFKKKQKTVASYQILSCVLISDLTYLYMKMWLFTSHLLEVINTNNN